MLQTATNSPSSESDDVPPLTSHTPLRIQDVYEQGQRALQKVHDVRARIVSPATRKISPPISSTDLCALCHIEKHMLTYRLNKGDLPEGTMASAGHRRQFTLAEAQTWIRAYRASSLRPEGRLGCTIATANFKGGSTKTTTAMTLAQGLSLRGHRVLAIDLDPQASLTQLFGVLSDTEVGEDDTLLKLFLKDADTVDYAIRPTYWSGVDLIAADTALFQADFALPSWQLKDNNFRFWDVLNRALDVARRTYDVIVIDTPPSLSYLTLNGLLAADGLIVPIPPGSLDFVSSAHFWGLFGDLTVGLEGTGRLQKDFDFIHVLLSRVNTQDAASAAVRQWITEVYGDKVLPVVIPQSAAATYAAAMYGTVYDLDRYEGSRKTLLRVKDAYDGFCDLIEQSIQQVWSAGRPLSPVGN